MSKNTVMFGAQVLVDQPQAGWQHHPEGSFSSNHMPSLDDEDYDDEAEEALRADVAGEDGIAEATAGNAIP